MSGGEKWWEGNILHHFTLPSSPSLALALTAGEDAAVLYAFIATKMLNGLAIILMDTFISLGNWLSLFWHFCGISQGFNMNLIYWVAAHWNPVLKCKWLYIQRQTHHTDFTGIVPLSTNLSNIRWTTTLTHSGMYVSSINTAGFNLPSFKNVTFLCLLAQIKNFF